MSKKPIVWCVDIADWKCCDSCHEDYNNCWDQHMEDEFQDCIFKHCCGRGENDELDLEKLCIEYLRTKQPASPTGKE